MSNAEPVAIDDCLSVRLGRLFVEGCDAAELARRFGTPLHVFSENQLRRNARRFREAFATRRPEGQVNVLPSIKANFTLAMRRILTQEGMGCDTFGSSELEAALRCGVRPELISVNGSVKDRALIERAVGVGAQWSIFDGGRRESDIREGNAKIDEALAAAASTEQKVRNEVRQALLDLDSARANAAKAKEQRDLAAENQRLVDVSYRAGAATAIEQADATAQLRNAEIGYTAETLGAQLAALRVLRAAGAFQPR